MILLQTGSHASHASMSMLGQLLPALVIVLFVLILKNRKTSKKPLQKTTIIRIGDGQPQRTSDEIKAIFKDPTDRFSNS